MIAKNKGDFLYNLHNELHRIGIDDDEEIFADFEEHFKASQEEGFTEEETCEKLGDVKEIARNYLDIESTRINSIVAGALENQRRVSLTKPGEKFPADLSLVKEQPEETPAIREYTPEHIAEETVPNVPTSPRINLAKPESPAQDAPAESPREYTPEHIAYEPEPPRASTSPEQSRAMPEYTPQHNAAEQPAPGDIPKQTDERYQYNSTSRQGEIPPQCVPPVGEHAKDGGFHFKDVKGMKANVSVGKLITCIVLDVCLWSWLIPMVISCIFGGLGSMALGLVTGGFAELGSGQYHVLSRIFLCSGMVSGGVLVGCAVFGLCKAVFHWIKAIVISHVKAIYGL